MRAYEEHVLPTLQLPADLLASSTKLDHSSRQAILGLPRNGFTVQNIISAQECDSLVTAAEGMGFQGVSWEYDAVSAALRLRFALILIALAALVTFEFANALHRAIVSALDLLQALHPLRPSCGDASGHCCTWKTSQTCELYLLIRCCLSVRLDPLDTELATTMCGGPTPSMSVSGTLLVEISMPKI